MSALTANHFFQKYRIPGFISIIALGIVIFGTIFFTNFLGKKQAADKPKEAPAVPVTIANVTTENVPLQINAIGNVEQFSTVSVKSEANGQLVKVHFTPGQYVKKGDLLFTIDPRPSEADLAQAVANQSKAFGQQRQAEANLAKDQVQANTAEIQAQRYATLYKEGIVSKDQYDQMRANADSLKSVVKADQAAISSEKESVNAAKAATSASRVQLGYTTIKSPIEGRTGSLMVNQGNIVKANDTTPLVVINQINPIFVTFAVPENQLSDLKRFMAQSKLQVSAAIPNDSGPPETGELTFVDNTVDPATGTVKLKATFANTARRLWPGQFTNITMTLTTQADAIVIPSTAVQVGQQGRYVFVVKPNQTVESRNIEVERTLGEKTIVSKGLNAGETVVTDGQLRLRPGSKIKVTADLKQPGQAEPNP